jgi:hypothetical protein
MSAGFAGFYGTGEAAEDAGRLLRAGKVLLSEPVLALV